MKMIFIHMDLLFHTLKIYFSRNGCIYVMVKKKKDQYLK